MKENRMRSLIVSFSALTLVVAACSGSVGSGPKPGTGGSPGSGGGGAGGASGGSGGGAGSGGTGGTGGTSGSGGGGGVSGAGGGGGRDAGSTGGTGGTGGGTGGSRGGTDSGPAVGRDSGADRAAGPEAGGGDKFSFFVTSLGAMRKLSKSQDGFGGDLRYGEATGLAGADKICTEIAEMAMPGAGAKTWRAFLSTVRGGANGGPVHAIERVGEGPWYDRLGRLVAANRADLAQTRPRGADPTIINDLPNETGIPNHQDGAPGCTGSMCPDNHDVLTGTNQQGMLQSTNMTATCNDWTSAERTGRPWCGHSWPRQASGVNWMSALAEGGCAPGVNLREQGGPNAPTVGAGGGYGGIYCFALTP
jgi:hypothetical protein